MVDILLLKNLLKNIDISVFTWTLDDIQAWKDTNGTEAFDKNLYFGNEFQHIISTPINLIMLLSLKAFRGDPQNITDYKEYEKSNCEIAIFIVDVWNIEIYCKDIKILDQIRKNIEKLNYDSIEDITDENDCRTRFSL
ncbi:MAG: DUF2691 family protein [Bacillota bacterium]|nr:DUF2691 family protein [Bacillota bacterium]